MSKTFQVIPPKLSQIVNNRLNVLCKIWDTLLYEERHRVLEPNIEDYALKEDVNLEELQQLMHKCKWMGEFADLKAYYRIFLLFIYRGLSLSDIDLSDADISNSHEMSIKAFRALKNVVGSNFRILLSVLVHLLKCFLLVLEQLELDENNIISLSNVIDDHKTKWDLTDLKRILARHYRVVTTLLRERTIYKHPFSYKRNVSGKLMLNLDRNVPYIFNIFRGVNLTNKRKETFHLLAKIRILQLLKQKEFRDKDVLIQFIAETFGYSKESLLFDLEELTTIGLASQIRKSNDNGDLYYEFSISRSGKYMIDTLIFEYSFLEIILNDIFIPKCFSKYFILSATSEYRSSSKFMKRIEFIPRVIRFIYLIKIIEKQEKTKFSINNNSSLSFDQNFEISVKIISAVQKTFKRMFERKDISYCKNVLDVSKKV